MRSERGRAPLAGLVLLAACATGAPRAPFTPAEVVSAGTANGATPMFVVTEDGREVLSWVAADGGGTDGVLHVRVRCGDSLLVADATVRDPLGGIEPHGESPPQLAASGDHLFVAYTVGKESGDRFPRSALRLSRSDDGGATWSEPVSVNEGDAFGSHAFHALLAGPDGAVYVTWLSSRAGSSGVWLRASHDGGRTWTAERAVHDDPTCPCCRTGLALAGDGSLYLSFRKVFPGDVRDVVVMRSTDGGAEWGAPVRPRGDGWVFPGCPHAGPSLRTGADGSVHIAWWTGKDGAAGVWYARSVDGGTTWESQPIDTASRAAPAHVQMQLGSDGRVVVGWDDGLGSRPRVLVRASRDGGAHFGPVTEASDPSVAATFPVLGLLGDSLIVAWSQTSDAAYRAEMAARPDMSKPGSRMALPRVGQQEVLARRGAIAALTAP